jgi:hypothetical protein
VIADEYIALGPGHTEYNLALDPGQTSVAIRMTTHPWTCASTDDVTLRTGCPLRRIQEDMFLHGG